MVRMGSNPYGSRPNFFGRQNLTFDKGGKNVVQGKFDSADAKQAKTDFRLVYMLSSA